MFSIAKIDKRQAFNLVIQRDSTLLQEDSQSMKTVAIMTLVFLPGTAVAVCPPILSPSSSLSLLFFLFLVPLNPPNNFYYTKLTKLTNPRAFSAANSLMQIFPTREAATSKSPLISGSSGFLWLQ